MWLITRKTSFLILLFLFCNLHMENSVPSVRSDGRDNANHDKLTPEDLLELFLVGSVLTNKTTRFNVLKDMLVKMWQPGQSMDITKIDENRFLFQFYHSWDLERVLAGGPWLYDNLMLATRKLQFREDPLAVPLNEVEIWVQVHQLPFGFMTEDVGVLIGNHIGKFVGYDAYNNYHVWRKNMRIKVAINVQLLLKKNWAFDRVEGDKVLIVLKFEKLGTFCFLCGIIGHSEKFCPRKLCSNLSNDSKGWGNFLRVESSASGGTGGKNKWLRNGRINEGGARSNKESTLNNQPNEEISSRGVCEQMLYGRVAIDRDPISKKMVFFKHAGRNGEAFNSWIIFNPADKGDVVNANGISVTTNGNVRSTVTDLEVALTNKMLVSNEGNSTMETEKLASTFTAVQVANNIAASPPNYRLRDAPVEIPRGNFKVFDNKIFLKQGDLNKPAATTTLLLTNGQNSKASNQLSMQDNTNSFTAGKNSGALLIPTNIGAADSSKLFLKTSQNVKSTENELSWKCEEVNAVLKATGTGPIKHDALESLATNIFVADMGKANGTQSSISRSKCVAKKISMKIQARRKPQLKGIVLSEMEFQQDSDMNDVKKRYRTSDNTIAGPNEQAINAPAAAFDLMLEDAILNKGAVGTNNLKQQIPDTNVVVTMAGTAQQACQDK